LRPTLFDILWHNKANNNPFPCIQQLYSFLATYSSSLAERERNRMKSPEIIHLLCTVTGVVRERWLRCREFIPRDAKRFHSGDRKISITQRGSRYMFAARRWLWKKIDFCMLPYYCDGALCLPRVAAALRELVELNSCTPRLPNSLVSRSHNDSPRGSQRPATPRHLECKFKSAPPAAFSPPLWRCVILFCDLCFATFWWAFYGVAATAKFYMNAFALLGRKCDRAWDADIACTV
jgi:hypothetical protein